MLCVMTYSIIYIYVYVYVFNFKVHDSKCSQIICLKIEIYTLALVQEALPVGVGSADEKQEVFDSISQFIGAVDKIKDSAAHEVVKGSKACLLQALVQSCADCLNSKLTAPNTETASATEQLKLFAASLPDEGSDCERKMLLQSADFVAAIIDATGSLFQWSEIDGDKNALGNEPALFALRRMSQCIDKMNSLGDEEAIMALAKTAIQCLRQGDSGGSDELTCESIHQTIVKMIEQMVSTISKWKELKARTTMIL